MVPKFKVVTPLSECKANMSKSRAYGLSITWHLKLNLLRNSLNHIMTPPKLQTQWLHLDLSRSACACGPFCLPFANSTTDSSKFHQNIRWLHVSPFSLTHFTSSNPIHKQHAFTLISFLLLQFLLTSNLITIHF